MSTTRIITGIATSGAINAHGERHVVGGITWGKSVPLKFEHRGPAVGRVTELWREGDGIGFRAVVDDDDIWSRIEDREIRGASVALVETKAETDASGVRVAKSGRIAEVSVCRAPANPDAKFEILGRAPVRFGETAKVQPMDDDDPYDDDEGIMSAQLKSDYSPAQLARPMSTRDVLELVGDLTDNILKRFEQVDDALAALESDRQKFCGPHSRALAYPRGSLVVKDGALWAAIKDAPVGAVPGTGGAWMLAAKSGSVA